MDEKSKLYKATLGTYYDNSCPNLKRPYIITIKLAVAKYIDVRIQVNHRVARLRTL